MQRDDAKGIRYPETSAIAGDKPVRHPNSFTFNVRLLVAMAEAFGAETVTMSNATAEGPITVEPATDTNGLEINDGSFGVLMPVIRR